MRHKDSVMGYWIYRGDSWERVGGRVERDKAVEMGSYNAVIGVYGTAQGIQSTARSSPCTVPGG